MWFWWVFRLRKLECRKRLVDKLIGECNKNIDEEVRILDKSEGKCSSCILYIVLFSIFFTIYIGITTYFVYYKYVNHNEKMFLNMIMFIKEKVINIKWD